MGIKPPTGIEPPCQLGLGRRVLVHIRQHEFSQAPGFRLPVQGMNGTGGLALVNYQKREKQEVADVPAEGTADACRE